METRPRRIRDLIYEEWLWSPWFRISPRILHIKKLASQHTECQWLNKDFSPVLEIIQTGA